MTVDIQLNLKQQLAARVANRQSTKRLIPIGCGTKGSLTASEVAETIDTRSLDGIVAYDPSEFLISALAGTSIATLQAVLSEHDQYLPFDPIYSTSGSTLGGTIAAGVSGSSSVLYGTLRDFVMEVEFIDGLGKLVRGGGKVVKNAAGFDLPKLMVGSYGRLGVLTEATLKVFPTPPSHTTAIFEFADLESALQRVYALQQQSLPIAAVDLKSNGQVIIRIATSHDSSHALMKRVITSMGRSPQRSWIDGEDAMFWHSHTELITANSDSYPWVAYATMSSDKTVPFQRSLAQIPGETNAFFVRSGVAAWIHFQSTEQIAAVDLAMQKLQIAAVMLKGTGASGPFLGSTKWKSLAGRVQRAIDPKGTFANY